MKTEYLSVFIDRGLYSLDKNETTNQPYNCIYLNCNVNFIQSISNSTLYINICMDNRIEHGLFSQIPILLIKKRDLLDGFDNNHVVELELNTELASISVLPKLSFS